MSVDRDGGDDNPRGEGDGDMSKKTEEGSNTNTGDDGTVEEAVPMNLDTLPMEVLLHITTFVPARDLIHSLALVSKHFYTVLNNEKTWEIRAKKMWDSPFPPILIPEDVIKTLPTLHRASTLHREESVHLWTEEKTRVLTITPHIACVDSVYLFKGNSMLASGGRDRDIALINLDNCIELHENNVSLNKEIYLKKNAHTGWIWDFSVVNQGESLVSAGWDGLVKTWDMSKGELNEVGSYRTSSPGLCLSSQQSASIVAAGTFDSKIHVFDYRTQQAVKTYRPHKRSVLALGLENDKIVSAGEDNLLVLYDLKAGKVMKRFRLPQPSNQTSKVYPKSISYAKTSPTLTQALPYFYVGDIRGNLYLVNLISFKIERVYADIHSQAIQGVFHSTGSVYTCSADGNLIIHEPGLELNPIKKVKVGEKVELPKVHCLNNRVAVAGSDSKVRVFYTAEEMK